MKDRIKWIVLGLLLLAIFLLTFMKTPEAITSMLQNISKEVKSYSAFVHILFLVVIGLGLLVKKIRNSLFSLFIAFLSLSATIISVKYVIAPNIIIFAMFLVLIIHAYLTKNLNFDLKNIAPVNLVFGQSGVWNYRNGIWLLVLALGPKPSLVECIVIFTIGGCKLPYNGNHLWFSLSESKTKISYIGGACCSNNSIFWLFRYFQVRGLC
ncbi:hypothetical protein AMJ74_06405 [candidate division WOR_3 bacterium SM1_77]|uniref:Uncharacterized protein n=1 Tax=candidate division WOR_3 bacterium SM1_77 TaxID=1703778 RepID=A0A0S8JSE6_UNCW3|nr:MAG: hypothetical protein AMJ74_06405 [candidate division WOR_3 bacterium SM1_77]